MRVTFVIACAAFVIGIAAGRTSVASNEIAAAALSPTISVSEIMKNVGDLPVQSYSAI
jgi:hypothetical protein